MKKYLRIRILFQLLVAFATIVVTSANARAAEEDMLEDAIPVEWFEPKVRSSASGLNFVVLTGRSEPGVSVETNLEQIIVIQRANPKGTQVPKVPRTLVKTNKKGQFFLKLWLPSGLSQVPITFTNLAGEKKTILLTMRVDEKDVNLNVKVTRKPKIVKVIQAPPTTYSIGVVAAPVAFKQNLSTGTGVDTKIDDLVPLSFGAFASMKYEKWWWVSHYRYGKASMYSLHSMLLGGRLKLTRSEHEVWVDLDVDGRFLPLGTVDAGGTKRLVDTQVFRAGVGLTYLFQPDNMSYGATLTYRNPFLVKVASGSLAYTPQMTIGAEAEVIYSMDNRLSFGLAASAEHSAYKYEYANSPIGIANNGNGTNLFFELMASVRFSTERKSPQRGL